MMQPCSQIPKARPPFSEPPHNVGAAGKRLVKRGGVRRSLMSGPELAAQASPRRRFPIIIRTCLQQPRRHRKNAASRNRPTVLRTSSSSSCVATKAARYPWRASLLAVLSTRPGHELTDHHRNNKECGKTMNAVFAAAVPERNERNEDDRFPYRRRSCFFAFFCFFLFLFLSRLTFFSPLNPFCLGRLD